MKRYKNITQKQINDFIKKHHLTYKQEIKDLYKIVELYDKALSGDIDASKKILEIAGEY